jgi:hypothetical protein
MSATLTPLPQRPQFLLDDGRAARANLRGQIARLERRLGELAFEFGAPGRSQPLPAAAPAVRTVFGPRVQTLGELEQIRDQMIARIRVAGKALSRCASDERQAQGRLEQMLADPGAHRFEFVERSDLGIPGCGAYHVQPRLGLLGMLFGWWCVKLSSGCP